MMVLLIHKNILELCKTKWTLDEVRILRGGSYLDHRLAPNNLEDLATSLCAIGQGQVDNLSISGELNQDRIHQH